MNILDLKKDLLSLIINNLDTPSSFHNFSLVCKFVYGQTKKQSKQKRKEFSKEKIDYIMGYKRMFYLLPDGNHEGIYQNWYQNGQLMEQYNYENNKINGIYQKLYANGRLMEQCYYQNGKIEGLYKKWHYDGQLMEQCNYKNNKKDGLYQYWDTKGKLIKQITFKENMYMSV